MRHICGGVIININHGLTAANCVHGHKKTQTENGAVYKTLKVLSNTIYAESRLTDASINPVISKSSPVCLDLDGASIIFPKSIKTDHYLNVMKARIQTHR